MQEEPTLETLLELGDRKVASGEIDRAIHYYNLALRTEPGNALADFKLAEAYRLKAETGGNVYRVLAAEALRRILKKEPRNGAVHEKLIVLGLKAGTLDALAREYSEKARSDPADGFYAGYLKRIYILSLMDRNTAPLLPEYRPVTYIKYFFDLMVLPAGVTGILLNNFGNKFRPFFALGLCLFLFYCAYRYILYLLLNRK